MKRLLTSSILALATLSLSAQGTVEDYNNAFATRQKYAYKMTHGNVSVRPPYQTPDSKMQYSVYDGDSTIWYEVDIKSGVKTRITDPTVKRRDQHRPAGEQYHWMVVRDEKDGRAESPVDKSLAIIHRANNLYLSSNGADDAAKAITTEGTDTCYYSSWGQGSKDGKYYATILVNDNINALPKKPVLEETTIGIDTGLKSFAVLSTGETIDSPTFSKNEKKHLATLQHSLCRKKKGSSNYRKAKLRVARLHSKISNRRSDFLHKLTHYLTRKSQAGTICVEDLNVKGMTKNHHLAYSIEDAGLGEFYRQLSYKCDWYGVNYRVIGRFEPSSKMCHVCGYRRPILSLSTRQWTCPSCGTKLDRDINAAINIKNFGLRKTLPTERGEVKPVEKPTMDDRSVCKI